VNKPILSPASPWWKKINEKIRENQNGSEKLQNDRSIPMNYYSSIKQVEDAIQR
jgi:2-hydroxyacyl-CoA lyase 1